MTDFNVIDETRQWIVPTLFHSKIDIYFIDPRGEIQVSSSNIKSINIKYKNKKYKQSKKILSNTCPSRKGISNSPVQILFTGKSCRAV